MNKESPHDRFVRLATKRTNTVLEKLRVLGNCANRAAYEYSDDEVEKMFGAISDELRVIKAKFQKHRSREFTL
jgi:bifunctional pyridoxal-dependent enzyme with beta-cystathionase and maltose regulon repressor activities